MPNATLRVVAYLLFGGMVLVLAWMGIGRRLLDPMDDRDRRRFGSVGAAMLAVGLAHPLLPLMGRDVLRQIQIGAGQVPRTPRVDVATVVLAAGSTAGFAALLVAI